MTALYSGVPPDLRPKAKTKPKGKTGIPAGKPKKPGNQVALNPGLRTQDVSLGNYLSSIFPKARSSDDIGREASDYVSSSINPIIANLTAEATKRIKAGSGAIKGVYDEYAGRLGGIGDSVRTDNAAAQAAEERAGGALRDYLGSSGAKTAADVGAAVGPGEPQGSALQLAGAEQAAGVGGLGKGVAGESGARGYTGLSELIAHGRADQGYADKLPGIARLEGLDALGGFSGQVEGDLRSKSDALLAQIPGMTADITSRLTSADSANRGDRATLLASFLGGSLDRNTQAAIAKAGLGKDATGAAIDWTNALGYKTDPSGNAVLDANGNLIPTEETVAHAATNAGKGSKAHSKAVANLAKARDTAAATVRTLAGKLSKPGMSTGLAPVTPSIPSRQGKYKKRGGGFTNDPAQAEQQKTNVAVAAKTYAQIFQLAMAQPEVTLLASRFALKPAEVAAIVKQGLAAAGVTPPAAKAPAAKPTPLPYQGPTGPGYALPPGR